VEKDGAVRGGGVIGKDGFCVYDYRGRYGRGGVL